MHLQMKYRGDQVGGKLNHPFEKQFLQMGSSFPTFCLVKMKFESLSVGLPDCPNKMRATTPVATLRF